MTRLIFALSFAASCAHPLGPGVRDGAESDDDDPALAGLALSVHALQVSDLPLEIWFYLAFPGASRDSCFAATDDYHVTVDGQLATMASSGGKARPIHYSGMEWQQTDCESATFLWRAGAGFAPTQASHVIVEHAGRRAEATISHLTTRRALRILPSDHVRPGDRMTIEWTPRDDEWPTHRVGATVRLYEPNENLAPGVGHARPVDSEWVNFGGALEGRVEEAPPHFHVTMPKVRPGPVHLGFSTNPNILLDAHPKILSCTGIARCAATVHNGPDRIVITVL